MFPKQDEIDDTHAFQATVDLGGRYDRKLRAENARIHSRPKKGEPLWWYQDQVWKESELVRALKLDQPGKKVRK